MPLFKNENVAAGISERSSFKVGLSDYDDKQRTVEKGVELPTVGDPEITYLFYQCFVECSLDSGIVVHRHLPQHDRAWDSLGGVDVGDGLKNTKKTGGVNLVSNDKFEDTVQRMAHSVYKFVLRGEAVRAGYEVPIPKLVSVGGVPAIPDDEMPQIGYNQPKSNYGGVVLFYAKWELHYTVAVPPKKNQAPPDNLAQQIESDAKPAEKIQAPWSQPDEDAQNTLPAQFNNPGGFIQGVR